jgi:hypothetical protein
MFNDMHRRFDTVGCLGICADVCVAIDSGISHACGDNIGYFRLEWRWLVTADRVAPIWRFPQPDTSIRLMIPFRIWSDSRYESMGQREHRIAT